MEERTITGCSQSNGGFRWFSYSVAQQWFLVHLNHVQIVPVVGAISSQSGHYGVALDLWMHSNNSPRSNVSSKKSKCSSPPKVFFILALMASNDEFLVHKG